MDYIVYIIDYDISFQPSATREGQIITTHVDIHKALGLKSSSGIAHIHAFKL